MKFHYLSRLEKVLIILLFFVFVSTSLLIGHRFYQSISEVTPSSGGLYSEGVVGKMQFVNPVFADLNPVDENISSLVFSGLMKYNTKTGKIEDDMAIHTLDVSKKKYTFTLKDDIFWHDGVPVTADDIMFTFQTVIQNVDFKNSLLRENFNGVEIKKINNKVVIFTLKKPYKFFLTNLTTGLLPKHILESVPMENLHLSEFNYLNPIGTGPYVFVSNIEMNGVAHVTLKRNQSYYGEIAKIEEIMFYIFNSFDQLQNSLLSLDAIQNIPQLQVSQFDNLSAFTLHSYVKPQYVAAFLNTQSEVLKNIKTRLGLVLSVNKEDVLPLMNDSEVIDTPFLELNSSNWLLQYDIVKAQGALNDAGWKLPWKQKVQEKTVEEDSVKVKDVKNDENFFIAPNNGNDFATSKQEFFIQGKAPQGTKSVLINNYALRLFDPLKGVFNYKASINIGTMKEGENIYTFTIIDEDNQKRDIDTLRVYYTTEKQLQEAKQLEYDAKRTKVITPEVVKEPVFVEKEVDENSMDDNIRINRKGDELVLKIISPQLPKEYGEIAKKLQALWSEVGVISEVELLEIGDLQEKVKQRDYDVLIFGQSLGYNLDSYPYWHSSQAADGFNFSQLKSFIIDTLLEDIRATHNEVMRQEKLKEVEDALIKEVPAIFLYSPKQYFAISQNIKGIEIENIRDIKDRYSHINDWYINEKRTVKDSVKFKDFFKWLVSEIKI